MKIPVSDKEKVTLKCQECFHIPNPETEAALEDAEQKKELHQFSSI